jgi:hypothetical protein
VRAARTSLVQQEGGGLVTEYELYADERRPSREHKLLWFGGLVCTDTGRSRLLSGLSHVRTHYDMTHEMNWGRVSQYHFDAYRAWVDVFFQDPFARFSLFQIDPSSPEWVSLRPRPGRRLSEDDRLKSAYYQFWLVTFGPLRDTKRWWVYADAHLFSRDTELKRVEIAFNRTYKRAFGLKSSRIVRLSKAEESKQTELIQLADVLLGAFSLLVIGERPSSPGRAQLVEHCAVMLGIKPTTQRRLPRLSFERWVPPEQFDYNRPWPPQGFDPRRPSSTSTAG